jgi:hypothetical protein
MSHQSLISDLAHEVGHLVGWNTEKDRRTPDDGNHSSLKAHIMSSKRELWRDPADGSVVSLEDLHVDPQWCEKMEKLASRIIP